MIPDIKELKKDNTIHFKYRNINLSFLTTYGLFSYKSIDEGTSMLLDNININNNAKIIDWGCGYGCIGISLAASNPSLFITMLDKDIVAINYSLKNIKLNNVKNIEVLLSNGFDELGTKKFQSYDYIISHLPLNVPQQIYYIFFWESLRYLKKHGKLYIVFKKNLYQFIKRISKEIFNNYELEKSNNKYAIISCIKK